MIRSYQDKTPTIGAGSYIDESAVVIGDVEIGENSSVWPLTVIRADINIIRIGDDTNIQDGSVLHTDIGYPLTVGSGVTIGHKVMLHGCTIEADTLIGIGSVILNGAVIPGNCIVGAKALITEGKTFPEGSLILGAPARVARELTDAEIASIRHSADHYVENAKRYAETLRPA